MTRTIPTVSILIGSKDRPDALVRCIKSALAQTYKNVEVLVLDDNSREKLCEGLKRAFTDDRIRCFRSDATLGVAGGRNMLIKEAKGDLLITLDDDAAFRNNDSISRIIDLFALHPDVGLFAFKIIDIIDKKEVGVTVPFRRAVIKRNPEIINIPQYVSYFLGGGHAVRKGVFAKCGPYQEDFFFSGEELDLSYRMIQNGYKIFYTPDVIVGHYPKYLGALSRLMEQKFMRYTVRNRIWISYKYLPWPSFIISAIMWSVIRIAASLFNGGFVGTVKATIEALATLRRLKKDASEQGGNSLPST